MFYHVANMFDVSRTIYHIANMFLEYFSLLLGVVSIIRMDLAYFNTLLTCL